MSRTLNRPMFRRGGKVDSRGTGITSGLMPRKNFEEGGRAEQIAEEMQNIQDLKNQFGLNYEMPEPEKGLALSDYINLIGRGAKTAFGERKDLGENIQETTSELASNIQTRKIKEQQDKEKAFGVRSGEFGAAQDVVNQRIAAEKEQQNLIELAQIKKSEQSYALNARIDSIGKLSQNIKDLEDQLNLETDEDKKTELKRLIEVENTKLDSVVKEDPLLKAFLDSNEGKYIFSNFNDLLEKEINPATNKEWEATDPGFYSTLYNMVKEALKDMQMGGSPVDAQKTQTTEPVQQEQILDYNQVRSRLPKEITDDIVTLIVTSEQAFGDFSEIQTQADVENFNRKYNVNLVLPQEA